MESVASKFAMQLLCLFFPMNSTVFFGVDFVMRNVQLEVLRIHQRSTTRNLQ